MMMPKRPIRVLHIIGALNRGGTETWLVNLLKHAEPQEVTMDFLVQQRGDPEFEAEVKAHGARIIVVPRNVRWAFDFVNAVRIFGPYDIIHSHRNVFSAAVLLMAKIAGPSRLVAHSHTSFEIQGSFRSRLKGIGVQVARMIINRLADERLATSNQASMFLYGESGNVPGGARVVFCGVDVHALLDVKRTQDAERRRSSQRSRRKSLGHVGAFKPVKNHVFMLDVFQCLLATDPDWEMIFVGDGPLRKGIEQQARERSLWGKISFMGVQGNVYEVLGSKIDVFLFPSKFEGLGLALVEAQLAGLPCVASSVVPEQAIVFPNKVKSLSLDAPVADWSKAIADAYKLSENLEGDEEPKDLGELDISASVKAMMQIYASLKERSPSRELTSRRQR